LQLLTGTNRENPISLRNIVANITRAKRFKTDCRAPREEEAITVLESVSVENFDSSNESSEIKQELERNERIVIKREAIRGRGL